MTTSFTGSLSQDERLEHWQEEPKYLQAAKHKKGGINIIERV